MTFYLPLEKSVILHFGQSWISFKGCIWHIHNKYKRHISIRWHYGWHWTQCRSQPAYTISLFKKVATRQLFQVIFILALSPYFPDTYLVEAARCSKGFLLYANMVHNTNPVDKNCLSDKIENKNKMFQRCYVFSKTLFAIGPNVILPTIPELIYSTLFSGWYFSACEVSK